ncbi:MAG: hypothetical protein HY904_21320 [Deltaproteobacteria bacterium]|nr:hypothetical protein [Deltaproteobacteria bacterium]
MAVKKKKKVAKKKVSRRGPMARTKRPAKGAAVARTNSGFSAPIVPMPANPVYPPRDYEECAALVVDGVIEMADVLPRLGLTPAQMKEMLGHSSALQKDEERLARDLAKAGGARVAYDDKVWRTCLKVHELARAMADDHPELAERFAFLAEFIKTRASRGTKAPPGIPPANG